MRKADLAAEVAGRAPVTKAQAKSAVNAVFEAVGDALARGDKVTVSGFGTFATRSRPARTGRNPRTGESVAVAASKTPAFKAGQALRARLRKGGPG
ncbi:MAG: HU family DNA-binding protein [Deltaproteobacteria bacterium]|nr:HU family DNA-binding protein [Deltaproteobacteria bacterium]